MKTNLFHSLGIAFISSSYTAYYCLLASWKYLTGTINRVWVDATIQLWSSKLLKIIKADYVIFNPHRVQPLPHRPTIVMCNHSSLYDIPLSFKAFPDSSMRMLAKKELSKVPFMGKGMVAAEFPFIDRKNRHQAIQDLQKVKSLMQDGIIMWIAPEGTRSKDGQLGSFKKGAFITAIQANATIIPIGIRGASEILPARTFSYSLRQKPEVHIGEPIDASEYTIETKDALIQRTHTVMQALISGDTYSN